MEGTGRWFTTLDEARAYVFSHFKNGARSFDVGCFQINYKWHGAAFRSIDDMFDPVLNALYAAEFLLELYGEFGDWAGAAGAYHSRTPEFAQKYAVRFDQIRANLPDGSETGLNSRAGRRALRRELNRDMARNLIPQPLVQGGTVALGSLVPIVRQSASARPFVIFK